MRITRRRVIAAAALGPFALHGCGKSANGGKVLRLAGNLPPTHPLNQRIKEAAERVGVQSGHELSIQLFPGSVLGSDLDLLAQLRGNAIQMLAISGLVMSILVPAAALSGIGFAFHDKKRLFAAMDGKVGALIKAAMARRGLIAMPLVFDSGFRQITTSTRVIEAPEDLAGVKLRVPLGALWSSMFRAFGAAPTSISFNETYSALQTHVVEGQENPVAVIDSGKLYEVQRHLAFTNHMWDGFWLLANEEALRNLTPATRDLLEVEFTRAALLQRADITALDQTLPAKMEAAGMVLNWPDPAPFRTALREAGFYRTWKDKLGTPTWHTLESEAGELA